MEARRALWEGVRAFHAEGGTVVLTSHYLVEIEALARRVRDLVAQDVAFADLEVRPTSLKRRS